MAIDIRQSTADPLAIDLGNISVQNRIVSKTIQMTLFTANENAVWAGRQHLLKISYPFAMIQIVANRRAFQLEVGDCFRFSYAKHGISNAVFRVLRKEEHELKSENVVVTAVEDFYFVNRVISEYGIPPEIPDTSIDYTIKYFEKQKIIESPYARDGVEEDRIIPLAHPEGSQDLGFEVHMSLDNGSSFIPIEESIANLAVYGEVVERPYLKNTYTIDEGDGFLIEFRSDRNLSRIQSTTWANTLSGLSNVALIGDEVIFFKNIVPVTGRRYRISGIIRNRMDTVRSDHPIGEAVWILFDEFAEISHPEIVPGASRIFKLVPFNVRRRGSVSNASEISVSLTGRSKTPYIPANFTANGSGHFGRYAEDVVLKWSARCRGKGAGIGIPGLTIPSNDVEGMFKIQVVVGGSVVRTEEGISSTTWTYTKSMNLSDNGSLAEELLFRLYNYRIEGGFRFESAPATVRCRLTT